jgi:hypothetical protein
MFRDRDPNVRTFRTADGGTIRVETPYRPGGQILEIAGKAALALGLILAVKGLRGSDITWADWAGLAGLACAIIAIGIVRFISGEAEDQREKGGRLATKNALDALESCTPASFDKAALNARRKLNKEIDRLAATIEAIPKNTGSYNPRLVAETQRRGAALREMHFDVATLTEESKKQLHERLISLKTSYDSGLWADLPSTDLVSVSRPEVLAVRIGFGLLAATCLGGIIYVLVVPSHLPPGGVSIATFVLGTLGLTFLGRAGLLTPASQQAIELATKAQGAIKPAPAGRSAPEVTTSTGEDSAA